VILPLKWFRRGEPLDPEAYDVAEIRDALISLKCGRDIIVSGTKYRTRCVTATRVIIVEGRFALYWKNLLSMFDISIFIECDADVALMRQFKHREVCADDYEERVKPANETLIGPTAIRADIRIPNTKTCADLGTLPIMCLLASAVSGAALL
jgi:uridine kinase